MKSQSCRAALTAAGWLLGSAGLLHAVPPPNNACSSATPIAAPSTTSGSTVEATPDGTASCTSTSGTPDVWYSINIPGSGQIQLLADLCMAGGYDTVLSLHTGCPGNAGNQIACDDDACGNFKSSIAVNINKGQTYYLRVSGYSGASGAFELHVSTAAPLPPPRPGPDITTSQVYDMSRYGPGNSLVNGLGTISVYGYGIGTESCNRGTQMAMWIDSGARQTEHPVIAQNIYRLKNGRFEQIGISWLKHSFLATNDNGCATCVTPTPPPGYSTGDVLGVNCSDIYSATLNDSQGNGPRFEVNGTTGVFPFPHSTPAYGGTFNTTTRRLQVKVTDVDPAQNAGARYFAEGHYYGADDLQWNNGLNSASYREVNGLGSAGFGYAFVGATVQQSPAIAAWATIDPTVVLVPVDFVVPLTYQSVTRDVTLRFWLGAKASDNGNGTWHYEYSIYNLNVDRAGQGFAMKLNPAMAVSNIGFSAPFYHSGEPCNNAPWTGTGPAAPGAKGYMSWVTGTYTGVTATDNATNALRWSTMYSYRFDAAGAPSNRAARLRLFKPGAGPAVLVTPPVPMPPAPCPADVADGVGNFGPDGFVTGTDFDAFVLAYFTEMKDAWDALIADITDGTGTGGPDGFVTGTDFDSYVQHFFDGC